MPQNPIIQKPKRKKPEEIVSILADKYGCSTRYVQLVISGERTNEEIFNDYMKYKEEHNLLLKSVKQVMPFDNQ